MERVVPNALTGPPSSSEKPIHLARKDSSFDHSFGIRHSTFVIWPIRVIRVIRGLLNVNVFVFIRVYSWLTFANG